MGRFKATITLEVNGKVVVRQPMRSFVKNWIAAIMFHQGNYGKYGVDTSGGTHTGISWPYGSSSAWRGWTGDNLAGAGVMFGTVVGSGSNAVTLTDYALQTIITTGAGAGQLAYQAEGYNATGVVGQVSTTRIQRSFINNSGGVVTVREVGYYAYFYESGIGYFTMMLCRDVVTPVVLQNGDTLNVYIDFKVTA